MDVKAILFKYVEKIALGLAICFLIYTIIYAVIVPGLETHKITARLLSQSNTIDSRLKISKPPPIEMERKEAALMEKRFTTPFPIAKEFERADIFVTVTKEGTPPPPRGKGVEPSGTFVAPIPGDTEFIYKGGTAELALIQVRKLQDNVWWAESFTVEKGQSIGQKKTIKKVPVDFDTHCKLREIEPFAQKAMTFNKTSIIRNDKTGEFLGTKLEPDKHAITTPKIVFENKKGEKYNLWVGELVNLGTETVSVSSSTKTSSNK